MPTYEYACRECGEHLEVVQSFKEAPLETCGLCGGPLRKVFSAAGIIFKGSGYYVTDSRKSDKSAESKGGSEATKAPEKKSGSAASEGTASKAESA